MEDTLKVIAAAVRLPLLRERRAHLRLSQRELVPSASEKLDPEVNRLRGEIAELEKVVGL